MIRPYLISDRPRVLQIFKLNTPKYFDPLEIKDFENYLDQKSTTYLVIEVDNNVVGGLGCYVQEEDPSGRITWIFFDPAYSGRGLGRTAVEHCQELLIKDKRVTRFVVTTSQFACAFLRSLGIALFKRSEIIGAKGWIFIKWKSRFVSNYTYEDCMN